MLRKAEILETLQDSMIKIAQGTMTNRDWIELTSTTDTWEAMKRNGNADFGIDHQQKKLKELSTRVLSAQIR